MRRSRTLKSLRSDEHSTLVDTETKKAYEALLSPSHLAHSQSAPDMDKETKDTNKSKENLEITQVKMKQLVSTSHELDQKEINGEDDDAHHTSTKTTVITGDSDNKLLDSRRGTVDKQSELWKQAAKHLLVDSGVSDENKIDLQNIQQETEEATALAVGMGMSFKYISNIDNVEQTFCAHFLLRYQWHLSIEENKFFEEAQDENNNLEFKPKHEPEFLFLNATNQIKFVKVLFGGQTYFKPDPIRHPLLIQTAIEILAEFCEPLELHEFPFDCQDLPIVIESTKNANDVILYPEFTNRSFVKFRRRHSAIPEWEILEPYCEFRKTKPSLSRGGSSFWQFILRIRVRRRPEYYKWRVILFMSLISLSAISAFTIDISDSHTERLELIFTIFFSAISFQFVANDAIPNVSYLTLLDTYISLNFGFILSIGFYTALSAHVLINFVPEEEIEDYVETGAFIVACVCWILLHAWFLIRVWYARKLEIRYISGTRDEINSLLESEGSSLYASVISTQYPHPRSKFVFIGKPMEQVTREKQMNEKLAGMVSWLLGLQTRNDDFLTLSDDNAPLKMDPFCVTDSKLE